MSVIYTGITAGSAATQARPADYFAGVKESLAQIQADKEQKNQDKLDALASIPNLSTTNMWDSHFQVAQEMDENLRDTLEEASESPESMAAWERRLQQRMDFVAESEAYYKNTAAALIQRAEIAGDPTLNPKELRDAGKIDGNTREDYEAEIARLDDIGQFSGVTVSGGRFVLPNNTPLLGIFDDQAELLKLDLIDMPPQRPEGWWSSHIGSGETNFTDIEAKNQVIAVLETNPVEEAMAINWYAESSGADRDKVDRRIAIDAYAEAAANARVKSREEDSSSNDTPGTPSYSARGTRAFESISDQTFDARLAGIETAVGALGTEMPFEQEYPTANITGVSLPMGGGQSRRVTRILFVNDVDGGSLFAELSGQEQLLNIGEGSVNRQAVESALIVGGYNQDDINRIFEKLEEEALNID